MEEAEMRKLAWAVTAALSLWAAWVRAQTQVDLGRQGKNVDFSGAAKTKPLRSGTELPATCEPGEMFFKADAPGAQSVYVCGPQDTWFMVGKELPSDGLTPGRVLAASEQSVEWKGFGGDVAGTVEALMVQGLQGRPLSQVIPSDGDVLSWSGALGAWLPAQPLGQYDPGTGVLIAGRAIAVDDATVPRYSTGSGAPAGTCEPGRDFYVDLSARQLYFCAAANEWRTGSGASWGAITGTLSNQADLWAALASKADATHSHNAGGDATGDLSALTVTRLQNRAVSAAAPSDGQALVWDAANGQWRPGTVSGGSSGWDPMDTSVLVLREDFCSGGTSTGQIGELGWATSTIAGTAISTSYNVGSLAHPCELRGIGVSSTAANDGKSLYLVNPTGPFQNATSTPNWEAKFIWEFPTYATDLRARIGLVTSTEPNVLVPTNFMGLRFDQDASWEPSGTTFIACVCNGNTKSNCTDVDTGVTVTADTWYKLHIWSDAAGVIRMRVNDGTTITFNNPSTLPGSTADFQPAWIVGRTGGSGNRQAYVDFFAGRVTGIAR